MKNYLVTVMAGLAVVVPCRHCAANSDDYVGRWNIEIQDAQDTFSTAWLRVDRQDGQLGGALMWRSGSVVPIKEIAVDGTGLHFQRGRDSFHAKLEEGELQGIATTRGGREFSFKGRRAFELSDASGTWTTRLASDAEAAPGRIVLETADGRVTGKAFDPQGFAYEVQDGRLEGRTLTFKAVPAGIDAPPRIVECEIRGDVMVGVVKVPIPGEPEPKALPIQGRRQRTWGQPAVLLRQNSLAGWGPRDATKRFGWKVEDGVLTNNPPDVDIMSEAKFGDFRLQLQYRVDPNSNSGVYLRGRYELQIVGSTKVQDHGNMAVYSRLAPHKNPWKPGEWNELDVTLIGRWLTVALNGETVHDNQYLDGPTGGAWDGREDEPGPLLLQGDHGKVWYRNIVVTPAG